MDVLNNIISKTCFFIVKTTFGEDYLTQEHNWGTSGHLLRYRHDGYDEYYKFLIYPDPDSEGKYRIINKGWPDHNVILESNRARIVRPEDSDYQRFEFKIASPPAIEKDKSQEWNYLVGTGVNLHVDFASHLYVYPSDNPGDRTKLKFTPADIVEPDATKVKAVVPSSNNEMKPPGDFVETNGEEWGHKEISIEAIPAALITDSDYRNKVDQLALSPYYYLKHEQLWSTKDLGITELSSYTKTTDEKKYYFAFNKSDYHSIEKTVGHTFNASIELHAKKTGEVSVKEGPAGASVKNEVGAALKLAYQYQNQTKTINQSSSFEESRFTDTIKVEYRQLKEDEEKFFYRHWLPIDRFTLTNSKGEVKGKWDYVGHKQHRSQKVRY